MCEYRPQDYPGSLSAIDDSNRYANGYYSTAAEALAAWDARFTPEQRAAQKTARERLHAHVAACGAEADRQWAVHLARIAA